jgi:uncharacterized protein (TIGR02391 family)
VSDLAAFERIVRYASAITDEAPRAEDGGVVELHPFEVRNIHRDLPPKVRRLFDDGHYPEATFLAFKYVERRVKEASGLSGTGFKLMMEAFDEKKPHIKLNELRSESDTDEQRGFRHIFAGAQSAIRNPRGHDVDTGDGPDLCLDHLSVASVLLRVLDAAE